MFSNEKIRDLGTIENLEELVVALNDDILKTRGVEADLVLAKTQFTVRDLKMQWTVQRHRPAYATYAKTTILIDGKVYHDISGVMGYIEDIVSPMFENPTENKSLVDFIHMEMNSFFNSADQEKTTQFDDGSTLIQRWNIDNGQMTFQATVPELHQHLTLSIALAFFAEESLYAAKTIAAFMEG